MTYTQTKFNYNNLNAVVWEQKSFSYVEHLFKKKEKKEKGFSKESTVK